MTAMTMFPDLPVRTLSRVYFGYGDNGQVKIGVTRRPSGRRGGEMHFTELCFVPGGTSVEDEYHQKYAAERITCTEWFHPSDRLLLDLLGMCTTQGRYQSVHLLRSIILGRLGQAAA